MVAIYNLWNFQKWILSVLKWFCSSSESRYLNQPFQFSVTVHRYVRAHTDNNVVSFIPGTNVPVCEWWVNLTSLWDKPARELPNKRRKHSCRRIWLLHTKKYLHTHTSEATFPAWPTPYETISAVYPSPPSRSSFAGGREKGTNQPAQTSGENVLPFLANVSCFGNLRWAKKIVAIWGDANFLQLVENS